MQADWARWISVALGIGIFCYIAFVLWEGRKRRDRGSPATGNYPLEVWVLLGLTLGLFVLTISTYQYYRLGTAYSPLTFLALCANGICACTLWRLRQAEQANKRMADFLAKWGTR